MTNIFLNTTDTQEILETLSEEVRLLSKELSEATYPDHYSKIYYAELKGRLVGLQEALDLIESSINTRREVENYLVKRRGQSK